MKLLFIYGPPGVGKLTVAQALSQYTDYKIFHNHMTANIAHLLFELGSPEAGGFSRQMRLQFFEKAAQHGISIIHTFAYFFGAVHNDSYLPQVREVVEGNGGEVCWIRLTCEREEHERRLQSPDRAQHHKLTNLKRFRQLTQTVAMFDLIPDVDSLSLDTTYLSAEQTAGAIVQHYKLNSEL